jgi:hypothetical protein
VGTVVEVLEAVDISEESRIRARIKSPEGWISISSTSIGDKWSNFHWAAPLGFEAAEEARKIEEARLTEEARKVEEERQMKAARNARIAAEEKAAAEANAAMEARLAVEKAAAERMAAEAKAAKEAKAKAEAEAKANADAEARTKAEAEVKAKAEAEVKAKAEAEAKAKAEAEARSQAEAEAQTKAEAKATAEAEAEAKAKAEAEVEAKEAEAKAKAEAEAKLAEAKAKVEAEAKAKAEAEAHVSKPKVEEMSKETVQQILQEIIESQKQMKVHMKALTKELHTQHLSVEETYQRVREVQQRDPLDEYGLSMMEFDQILDKFQSDPTVRDALAKIMGAPDPSNASSEKAQQITVEKIIEVHQFMLEEMETLVKLFQDMPKKEELNMKTVTVAAQVIVSTKIEDKFSITSEDIEFAELLHHTMLASNLDFATINKKIQHTMESSRIPE